MVLGHLVEPIEKVNLRFNLLTNSSTYPVNKHWPQTANAHNATTKIMILFHNQC